MSEQTTADDAGQVAHEPEWIVYQIGGPDRDKFRFIITRGFRDMAVTAALKPFEFIDTTTTLLGEFGGDVTVLGFDELLKELKSMLHIFDRGLSEGTIGRTFCDAARAAIAKAEANQ